MRWAPGSCRVATRGAGGRRVAAAGRGGRGVRPRDGGPGQGHTAPCADSLAGPAPRPGAESAPSGRAAPPQFPRRRAGRGRGRRAVRAAGRGPVTCGRRRRASPLCPVGWSSSRPRSRSPSRALDAAPPPGSGPHLAAPSPERDRPEGRRTETRLRDVGAGPRGAVRQDGGAHFPAAGRRPSVRPRSQAPGGALPAARGVGGGRGRPGRPLYGDTPRWARPYGKMAAPASPGARPANALAPRPRCPPAPASAAPTGHRWSPRRERRRPSRSLARGLRPSCWDPPYAKMAAGALPRALPAPPALRIGPSGGPSRRVADPSERRGAQSAAGEGRWTQVRPCPGAGDLRWRLSSP